MGSSYPTKGLDRVGVSHCQLILGLVLTPGRLVVVAVSLPGQGQDAPGVCFSVTCSCHTFVSYVMRSVSISL